MDASGWLPAKPPYLDSRFVGPQSRRVALGNSADNYTRSKALEPSWEGRAVDVGGSFLSPPV
jgi:hypothetical protein